MGHATPLADLMAVSPEKKEMFLVDVEGLYRKNPWLMKTKEIRSNLYYILAYVPAGLPNEFFIMTQAEAYSMVESELKRLGRPEGYGVHGFLWSMALKFADSWEKLPR
jgi:hypothetical protein